MQNYEGAEHGPECFLHKELQQQLLPFWQRVQTGIVSLTPAPCRVLQTHRDLEGVKTSGAQVPHMGTADI